MTSRLVEVNEVQQPQVVVLLQVNRVLHDQQQKEALTS